LWSGVSILKITGDTLNAAAQFNEDYKRAYAPHILGNVAEIGGTVGWAVLLLLGFGAVLSAREIFRGGGRPLRLFFNETPVSAAVCVFAFSLTLIALDLSGANRAEVSRLWIFLMPLIGACALWAAERLKLKNYMPMLCALLCAEGILMHAQMLLWPF
jgi:hypothetical protein